MPSPPVAAARLSETAGFVTLSVMTPDLLLLQAALDRQIAVLAPIAHRLRLAVAHPPIAPQDWAGPASRAYADLEAQLRARLRAAGDAVESALHDSRLARGQLHG